ncbi:acetate--CoA ligase family protein, partial [candidate division KSB1 bacterium]|nr:acetate--CoA ligase family protein [candidate division KSB1 bacterium]
VVFRVLPLTDRDAREMILSTRAHRLLKGYRGAPEADIASVEDLLLRLGALAEAVPQIAEIDLWNRTEHVQLHRALCFVHSFNRAIERFNAEHHAESKQQPDHTAARSLRSFIAIGGELRLDGRIQNLNRRLLGDAADFQFLNLRLNAFVSLEFALPFRIEFRQIRLLGRQ